MSWLEYLILFAFPLAGGLVAIPLRNARPDLLNLALSFSGAFLIGITFMSLLPQLFSTGMPDLGVFIMVGFFLQILLDQLSKGVEHGHIHVPDKVSSRFGLTILAGLSIHAFLEGIPLSGMHSHALMIGIAVHKIPAAFTLASVLLKTGTRVKIMPAHLLFFIAMTPLAAWLTEWAALAEGEAFRNTLNLIYAMVIGSFLHISTTILFEVSTKHHRFTLYRLMAISAGLAMALLTV